MSKKKVSKKKTSKDILPLVPTFKATKKMAPDIAALEEALDGRTDLVLFLLCWLKNGMNSTKAYLEMKPGVRVEVAAVMGSRKLKEIKEIGGIDFFMEFLGMGVIDYFQQLKEGMNAMIRSEVTVGFDDDGNPIREPIETPDHKTRRTYHKALGQILKIEGADIQINNTNQNLNNNQNSIDNLQDDELDDLIS